MTAVAAVIGVAGLPVPGGHGGTAYAATPPLLPASMEVGTNPQATFERLAAAAANSSAPGQASSMTMRWQSWSLFTRVDGKTVHSVVEPQLHQTTRNSDGSGSTRTVIGSGSPDQPLPAGHVLNEQQFGPGAFNAFYPQELPTEPAAMLEQLKVGHPIDDLGTAELFVAIQDLLMEQNPGPAERSAILQVLRGREDIVDLGPMTDRAGRTGTALAVDSDYGGLPTRYILVFDDKTGGVLASEDVLTTTPGKLNVPIPAVISYELWGQRTS